MYHNDKHCSKHNWSGQSFEHCPRCERLHEQKRESNCSDVSSLQRYGCFCEGLEPMFEDEEGEWVRFSDVCRVRDSKSEIIDALKHLIEAWDEFQNPDDGVVQDARQALLSYELSYGSETLWRERFEAWASLYYWFDPRQDPKERDDNTYLYADAFTDQAWMGWLRACKEARKYNV